MNYYDITLGKMLSCFNFFRIMYLILVTYNAKIDLFTGLYNDKYERNITKESEYTHIIYTRPVIIIRYYPLVDFVLSPLNNYVE